MRTPGPPTTFAQADFPMSSLAGPARAAAGAEPGPTQTLVEWNTYGSAKSRFYSDSLMLVVRSSDGGLVLCPGCPWFTSLPQLSAGESTAFFVSPKSLPGQRWLGYSGAQGGSDPKGLGAIKDGNLADSSEKS